MKVIILLSKSIRLFISYYDQYKIIYFKTYLLILSELLNLAKQLKQRNG